MGLVSIHVKVRLRYPNSEWGGEWFVLVNDFTSASYAAEEIEKLGRGFARCRAEESGPDRFIRASEIDRIEVYDG